MAAATATDKTRPSGALKELERPAVRVIRKDMHSMQCTEIKAVI